MWYGTAKQGNRSVLFGSAADFGRVVGVDMNEEGQATTGGRTQLPDGRTDTAFWIFAQFWEARAPWPRLTF